MFPEWHTLNFARPDDLPFTYWMDTDGSEAKIYVTVVGNHDKELERKLCYTEGVVVIVPLTEEVLASLQRFVEKATPHGVAVLYQRVAPVPKAPCDYGIRKQFKCGGEHYHCDHYDDGYCMSRNKCTKNCKVTALYVNTIE